MIKVDGFEPTEGFKNYIELEKSRQVAAKDLKKYLDKEYMGKQDDWAIIYIDAYEKSVKFYRFFYSIF